MSRVGLDWYKREPVAYLGDVQGLSSKEHAVYSVVIDLLYVHGGVIPNDPKFISGYISDMGSASVRRILASLGDKTRITLDISDEEITQKRAKNEVKTKQKLTENARKTGEKGGKKSAELRATLNENKDLDQGDPSNEIQPEKRREEKRREEKKGDTIVSLKKAEIDDQFSAIWDAYPKKVGKQEAKTAYGRALKKVDVKTIVLPLRQFIAIQSGADKKYIPHLSTWLNQERWQDVQADTSGSAVTGSDQMNNLLGRSGSAQIQNLFQIGVKK